MVMIHRLALVCVGLLILRCPTFAGPLESGRALLAQGADQAAAAELAKIPKTDPHINEARLLLAGAYQRLGDGKKFMRQVDQLDAVGAVPVLSREELLATYITAATTQKMWEALTTRTLAFQRDFPASTYTQLITETRMAALFERGIKKAMEAGYQTDAKAQVRSDLATADLQQFVNLALTQSGNDYRLLENRKLQDDLIRASVALGDTAQLIEKLSGADPQRMALLTARMHVGSSRVDLQACKLEYSIVSPK